MSQDTITDAIEAIETACELHAACDAMRYVHDGKHDYLWDNLSNAANRLRGKTVAITPSVIHRLAALRARLAETEADKRRLDVVQEHGLTLSWNSLRCGFTVQKR